MAPIASETSESDEIARKMLQNVSSLVDEEANQAADAVTPGDTEPSASPADTQKPNGGAIKKTPAFVYALPGEVLKTSLNRHHRGIMDPRIYQLLTKKEIILPQVLSATLFTLFSSNILIHANLTGIFFFSAGS